MSAETPRENPLDRQLQEMRFSTLDAAVDYLRSLRIDPGQFRRNARGQLLSVHGTILAETDPRTGEVKFSEMGVSATAEWIEDLGWAPDCFWGIDS